MSEQTTRNETLDDLMLVDHSGDVLAEIVAERKRQCEKGYDAAHDDGHTLRDLADYVIERAQLAYVVADDAVDHIDVPHYEKTLLRVAAIAVAAVESSRRRRAAAGSTKATP